MIVCPMCFGTLKGGVPGCGHDMNCVYWDTMPNQAKPVRNASDPTEFFTDVLERIGDEMQKDKDEQANDAFDRAMRGL